MTTSNISVRVDSELKKEAEDLFNDIGLNMSSAINIFLKSAVSYNGIPFEIKRPALNEESLKTLAEYQAMKDPCKYKRYESFDQVLDEVFKDA